MNKREEMPRIEVGQPHAASWIGILAVYCCTWMASLSWSNVATVQTGGRILVSLIGATLAVSSWVKADKLAQAASVLHDMQVPSPLWQRWLRAMLASQWRYWLLASLVGSLILVLDGNRASWAGAPMLYSIVMTLFTVLPLAQRKLLPRASFYAIALGLPAYMLLSGPHFYDWPMSLPLGVQLALVPAWPLLALGLKRRWEAHMPAKPASFATVRQNAWRRVGDWIGRFSLLSLDHKPVRGNQRLLLVVPFIAISQIYIGDSARLWGHTISLTHVIMMTSMVPYAGMAIYCRDLHWRRLLAPGGFRHGMLGWHIIGSTLQAYAIMLAPIILAVVLLPWLFATHPMLGLQAVIQRIPLLAEAIFIICLGAAIRGARNWLAGIVVYFGITFLLILVVIAYGDAHLDVAHWRYGWTYLGILLLGSLLALLLANRLWNVQRLLPYCMQRSEEPSWTSARWWPRLRSGRAGWED